MPRGNCHPWGQDGGNADGTKVEEGLMRDLQKLGQVISTGISVTLYRALCCRKEHQGNMVIPFGGTKRLAGTLCTREMNAVFDIRFDGA